MNDNTAERNVLRGAGHCKVPNPILDQFFDVGTNDLAFKRLVLAMNHKREKVGIRYRFRKRIGCHLMVDTFPNSRELNNSFL